jgi:hypothetical protein
VIEVLLVLALASQTLIWLAPAPLLGPIIKDLHIHLADAGLIISIIALVFQFSRWSVPGSLSELAPCDPSSWASGCSLSRAC